MSTVIGGSFVQPSVHAVLEQMEKGKVSCMLFSEAAVIIARKERGKADLIKYDRR
jgi:hypothetical protein